MSDPNQGFFIPEEKVGDYDTASAFQQFWKQDDGAVMEYVITDCKLATTKSGQNRVEFYLEVASGEHAGKKPANHAFPMEAKWVGSFREINMATGVNPQRDANGRIPMVPAWYIGKRFIATAFRRSVPNATDPSKEPNIYVDLRNLAPVPQGGQQYQQAPQQQLQQPQAQPTFQQPQQAPPQQVVVQSQPQLQQAPQQVYQQQPTPAFAPNQQPQMQQQPQLQQAPVQGVPVRRNIPGATPGT